ncbi:MAG: hypothetical protein WAX77_07130 [Methylococcaceae bacterium]
MQTFKPLALLKLLLSVNVLFSVILLLTGCFLSLFEDYSLFEFNHDLYGELINSFRVIMVYIGVTELVLCSYCWLSKKFQLFIFIGFFLVLMTGSVQFYAEINEVEIDANIPLFFLYIGLSHIAFGVLAKIESIRTNKRVLL